MLLAMLYFRIGFLGRAAGRIIHRRARRLVSAAAVGAGVGLLCWVLFSVVFGLGLALTTMRLVSPTDALLMSVLMSGVQAVLLGFYGFLPAIIGGALYGCVLRAKILRLLHSEEA